TDASDVDAHQRPGPIQHASAADARVHSRVGLQETYTRVGFRSMAGKHTARNRRLAWQVERIPDDDQRIALLETARVAKRGGLQVICWYVNQRQVDLGVGANQVTVQGAS